jgi:hypothetical protein
MRRLSIEGEEPQQGAAQIGNARQKLDLNGNSLKIEKKFEKKHSEHASNLESKTKMSKKGENIKYEDSRNVIGIEKSLK